MRYEGQAGKKKGSPFDLSQANRLSDQAFLEKGYVIEAIVSPEECFSILPLIRYVFLSLGKLHRS